MPTVLMLSPDAWTYGAEHELADWDTRLGLPFGFGRADDWTLVNTNGIAVPPRAKFYPFGGEINTPPTGSISGQLDALRDIVEMHPTAAVNHRSNLHIHIRVPGLKHSLRRLKQIQKYIHGELPRLLPLIEPIPDSDTLGGNKRRKRRKVSHQTLLTPHRLSKQLDATTVKEFFEFEVPRSKKGQVMWHAQPRLAVNLRQLLQTNTIEFRHFPGTLHIKELRTCIEWCRDFLLAAITGEQIDASGYVAAGFPKFSPFVMDREVKYQATCYHGELKQPEIHRNVELILKGEFDGSEAEAEATERACGVSRKHL